MTNLTTIEIIPIPALSDNYIYALIDHQNQSIVIVDPGEAEPVMNFMQSHPYKLAAILLTHHHWDHTNGINEILASHAAPVYGPTSDNIPSITNPVNDNDLIQINHFSPPFRVFFIPGHTNGHVAYYSPGMLFSGDTLFSAGCGRIFEGTAKQMYQSLSKMAALPEDTRLYCAHEYTLKNLRFAATVEPNNQEIHKKLHKVTLLRHQGLPSLPSTLHEEKATNPFLRCHSPEIKATIEKQTGQQMTDPLSIFIELRKWKDQF